MTRRLSSRRLRTTSALATMALAGVVSLEACREPTQVTLVLSTDVPCGSLRGTAIVTAKAPGEAETRIPLGFYSATTEACEGNGQIGTLVVTPSDAGRGAVVVIAGVDRRASDCNADNRYFGCVVARRAFAFVDHTSLTIPIELSLDCKNVPCDAVSTCKKGACVSSELVCGDGTCAPGVEQEGGLPASDARDEGEEAGVDAADAATDAPRDAKSDAPLGTISCATTTAHGAIPCDVSSNVCCYSTDLVPTCKPGLTNCVWAQSACAQAGSCPAGQSCCEVDIISTASGGEKGWKSQCTPGSTCAVGLPFCVTSDDCPASTTCAPVFSIGGSYGNANISWKRCQ